MTTTKTEFLPGFSHTDAIGDKVTVAVLSDGSAWIQTIDKRHDALHTVVITPAAVTKLVAALAAGVAAGAQS